MTSRDAQCKETTRNEVESMSATRERSSCDRERKSMYRASVVVIDGWSTLMHRDGRLHAFDEDIILSVSMCDDLSILSAKIIFWRHQQAEIEHNQLRQDFGLEKQVAARQADGDLGHVPMMLCPVLLFARSGMPTEKTTMLIIRAKALIASALREEESKNMSDAVLSAESRVSARRALDVQPERVLKSRKKVDDERANGRRRE
ncbi:hypothetical protein Q7P35_010022 [Cladosporium inversicolor]